MRLNGKVGIITGGASGIGAACVRRFVEEGAKVVIADVDEKGGDNLVSGLGGRGKVSFVQADVTGADGVRKMVESTVKKYGRLDVLFNNAGINPTGGVVSTSLEDWEKVMAVNLRGVFLGCKYAVPVMVKQGGGSIINMGSVAGMEAGPVIEIAYEVSKAGVIAITKSVAQEYASKKVRVNCICPGGTMTPLVRKVIESMNEEDRAEYVNIHPMGRLAKPEEIAALAVFLASDESSFITGASIPIDGGRTAGIRPPGA